MRLKSVFKILGWIAGFVGIGGFVTALEWLSEDQTVSVDIHFGDRCARGSLQWMKNETLIPESWALNGAATQLRICDNVTISEQKPKFPAALARSYPGCLDIDEENKTLTMQLNVEAVCYDREKGDFLCDGADRRAQVEPASSSIVEARAYLMNCTASFFENTIKPNR